MQLRVLGPVDLHDDSEVVALPGTRLPRLLATLAAADGRTVAVGTLADAIWSGAAPPTAAGAIQVAVSQARRLIAQGSEPGPSIVTETGGYRLVATAEQLDLLAFHDLLDRARRCAHEQRHHDRAEHLQRALALWRGEPFGALDDAGTVAAEGRRLHELRLDAEEDLVATQVQLGREREVLPTITRLLGDHPFRERLVGLQMLALYRAGRPVEALDTYEQFRRRLRDELGVQPGKELRSLERLVLLQHPSLDLANTPPTAASPSAAQPSAASVYVSIGPLSGAAAPPLEHRDARAAVEAAVAGRALGCGVAASPVDAELLALAAPPGRVLVDAVVTGLVRDQPTVELRDLGEHRLADLGVPRHVYEVVTPGAPKGLIRSCSVVPTSLGSEPTEFVGRRGLRARLGSVVAGARMVTLVGPPGAGKTRLARRVAAEQAWAFPGGAWLVELGPVATAADLELAMVSALQLTVRVDAEPMAELGTRLQTRTLVVLDNAEHLVDELAPLLAALVERAPASTFVVTSRRRIGVQGEVVVPVGPLIDNDAALAEPERRAGLDDALAILRARLADLGGHSVDEATAQALVEQVDGLPLAIELVAGQVAALGGATVLERLHQLLAGDALEAALRGSEQLLGEVDRAVLRRMSVFAAPVDLRAAEAVVADGEVLEAEVAPALARLVEASLLGVVEVAGVRRFRMLATVRVLAAQRLTEGGDEAAATLDRQAHWAARSGWKLAAALVGREPAAARNELELLLPNLRATFAHLEAGDDRDRHIFAVAGMWFFWYFTGRLHEGRAVTLAAVRRPGGRPQHRALGLAAAANLAWWQCDYREARRCLAEARAVTGVPDDLAFFEIVDGALAWIEGDLDAAATSLRAAMARAREAGRFDLPMAAAMAGNVEWWRGDHAASAAIYREGREASVTARNAFTAALCARHEALQLALMGRVDEARPLVQQALAECRRLGDVMGEGQSLVYAGLIEMQAGHPERATVLLAEGVRTAVQPGDLFCLVVAAPAVAELLASHGEGDDDGDRDQVAAAARWLGWRDATMARAGMLPSAAQQELADAVGVRVAEVLGDGDRLHRAEGAALTLDELAASLAGW